MTESISGAEWVQVGERLRESRQRMRLSLRELARRVGVSASHISQVERGLASLSVPVLYAIVGELDVSMDSLFEGGPTPYPQNAEAGADGAPFERSELDVTGIVQRRGGRPTITMANGLRWQRLTSSPLTGAEFIEVIYEPGGGAGQDDTFIRHSGHEYGLVLEGELTVQVGFDQARLQAGDSIHFDSTTPHRFWNTSAQRTRAVWFILEEPGGGLGHHLSSSDAVSFAQAMAETAGPPEIQ